MPVASWVGLVPLELALCTLFKALLPRVGPGAVYGAEEAEEGLGRVFVGVPFAGYKVCEFLRVGSVDVGWCVGHCGVGCRALNLDCWPRSMLQSHTSVEGSKRGMEPGGATLLEALPGAE